MCSPSQLDCADQTVVSRSGCQQQCEGLLITNIDHDIEVENAVASNNIYDIDNILEDYEHYKNHFEKKVNFSSELKGSF